MGEVLGDLKICRNLEAKRDEWTLSVRHDKHHLSQQKRPRSSRILVSPDPLFTEQSQPCLEKPLERAKDFDKNTPKHTIPVSLPITYYTS